jgi:pyruvate/2-oxoacid:ferredoxin oxidoreductase alpha subunit
METAYSLIQKAIYYQEIYQHPIIILLDKQFSESHISVNEKKLQKLTFNTSTIKYNIKEYEIFKKKDNIENNNFLRYSLNES